MSSQQKSNLFQKFPNRAVRVSLLALICLGCYSAAKIQYNVDFETYLGEGSNHHRPFVVAFKSKANVAMNHDQICGLWSWVQTTAVQNKSIESIFSPFEARKTVVTDRQLSYERIVGDHCYKRDTPKESVNELRNIKHTPWENIITNSDANDLLIEFRFKKAASTDDLKRFSSDINSISKALNLDAFKTGEGFLQLSLYEGLKKDQRLNILLMLLFVVLFRMIFHSWAAGFALISCLFLSALGLALVIEWSGLKLNLLTNGIFLICSIAALQDFIFIYQKLRRSQDKDVETILKSVKIPCFATTLTTVIGFGSLYLTDVQIIKEFGILAAVGSLIEFGVLFYALPFLVKHTGFALTFAKSTIGDRLSFEMLSKNIGKRILAASFILLVLSPFCILLMSPEENPLAAFEVEHELRSGTDYLRSSRGWESEGFIEFTSNIEDDALNQFATNVKGLKGIVALHHSISYIDHFTAGFTDSMSALIKDEISQSFYYSQYFTKNGFAAFPIYIDKLSPAELMTLKQNINDACHNTCIVRGPAFNYAQFSNLIVPTLLKSFIYSLGSIIVFMVFYSVYFLGRIEFGVIIWSFWGAIITVGVFYIAGDFPVNYLTCIMAAVLLGTTGDNALHYIYEARLSKSIVSGIDQKSADCVLITLFMIAGSVVLLASYFTYPRMLGKIFVVGFTLSLFGDIWLTKAWTILRSQGIAKKWLESVTSTSLKHL